MTTTVLKSNDLCWCGSGRKYKRCHKATEGRVLPGKVTPLEPFPESVPAPEYARTGEPRRWNEPRVKSADVIARMRRAGRLAAEVLALAGKAVQPGVTTEEIDRYVRELCLERNAYPSPLNYHGYPKSVCTSVNEVLCHGIPDDRPLQEGDIVNLDVTLFVDGVHGDTNATFLAGDVAPETRALVEHTREALDRGIRAVKPGRRINVVGRVIEAYAARHGYGVVREFTGHGIGTHFHSGLVVPHYDDPDYDDVIQTGMTFTIEPMLNLGTHEWDMWEDGWTAVTRDLRPSAQFEHTLLVTAEGAEVLTVP